MGKDTGFKEFERKTPAYQPVEERIRHWNEFAIPLAQEEVEIQGARCMNCGVPFCHPGCPLGNVIPDFNDHAYQGKWQRALKALYSTNNFPEFTGRVCPAPCESACVLGINKPPVTIKNIEVSIIERAFQEGWAEPRPPRKRTGQIGGGGRARARRGSPPPTSSTGPGTRSRSSSGPTGWAGFSATGSPTSSCRSRSSTAASS